MCKVKRQTIYVLGYPKSGTTWLARLLGDTLNSPVGGITPDEDDKCIATEGRDRSGPYYIRHGHAVPVGTGDTLVPDRFSFAYKQLKDERVVILIRDPRDVAVSASAHWGMDLEKTLHCMGCGEWPLTHGGGWVEWVGSWLKETAEANYALRYEHLLSDIVFFITNIISTIAGEHCDIFRVHSAVARQSITARRAWTEQHGDDLNYGKEAQLRFLRKGVVGDWKNHFAYEHRRLAEEYFGETMRELGYTESEEWVNE